MSKPVPREIYDLPDLIEACDLFNRVWRPPPAVDIMSVEMMRAFSHSGNYVSAAYLDGRMVGAAVAFFADPPGTVLRSQVLAAEPPGKGVGFVLKRHQRDWALARGISTITWTYDPLISRNAHFNLVKVGAVPVEYLPSFYGQMADQINDGDESDRLLVSWKLDGMPGVKVAAPAETVLIAVPRDIEELRTKDPGLAAEWRTRLRAALEPLMATPDRFLGFHDRSYVFRRTG